MLKPRINNVPVEDHKDIWESQVHAQPKLMSFYYNCVNSHLSPKEFETWRGCLINGYSMASEEHQPPDAICWLGSDTMGISIADGGMIPSTVDIGSCQ